MAPTLASSIAVAITALVTVLMWKHAMRLRAADYYGRLFVSVAKRLMNDPEFPEAAKLHIKKYAKFIDDGVVAVTLGHLVRSGHSLHEGPDELLPLLQEMEPAQAGDFTKALFYLFYAMSYLDRRNGWFLRRRLTTDERRAVQIYAHSADVALARKSLVQDGAIA